MRITNPFAGLEHIVQENVLLKPFTWYKLGGPARYFVRLHGLNGSLTLVDLPGHATERRFLVPLGRSDLFEKVALDARSEYDQADADVETKNFAAQAAFDYYSALIDEAKKWGDFDDN